MESNLESDPVREAFSKAKKDIKDIASSLLFIGEELQFVKSNIAGLSDTNQNTLSKVQQNQLILKDTLQKTLDTITSHNKSIHELIDSLKSEQERNSNESLLLKESIAKLEQELYVLRAKDSQTISQSDNPTDSQTDNPTITNPSNIPNNQQDYRQFYINTNINQTDALLNNSDRQIIPTDNPTDNTSNYQKIAYKSLISNNLNVSTGNQGVPADRQTDQQTDNPTHYTEPLAHYTNLSNKGNIHQLLEGLDELKKDIRIKFKELTNQEMLIFSTIYQLEEESQNPISYNSISLKTRLTESSVRDYVQKLTKKGIPVLKIKEKNKKILVYISPDLKKIATLSSILQLREL